MEAIGPNVTGVELGTPVVCAGQMGFSKWVVLAADRILPMPSGVNFDEATFIKPLVCCGATVQNARVPTSATVLITCAEPMGPMLLQPVKRGGASQI